MASLPSIANFRIWIQNVMGVPAAYLPPTAPAVTFAFDQAMNIVNPLLGTLYSTPGAFTTYELAVYNLGGHNLIEYAPDQSYSIAAVSWSGGVVTVTTSAANAIIPGDQLAISGVSPNTYNGNVTAFAVLSSTQFTYPLAPNPGPGTPTAAAVVAETFFLRARQQFKISTFVPGVVTSSSDVTTSTSLDNPEFMKCFTLSDLQLTKTPWGREYLSLAQLYGPTIWGMS